MTVELSTITFTEQDDIVPVSGVEQIFNTGIANTFSGNDAITGTGDSISTVLPVDGYPEGWPGLIPGIYNDIGGTIDTGDGDDIITGISYGREGIIPDYGDYGNGIINGGTIDTGNGNDLITGIGQGSKGVVGITSRESEDSIINTGDGDDTIMGTASATGINIHYSSTLDTGKGDDIITGDGSTGLLNASTTFNTGDGNDTITGNCNEYGVGFYNAGFINTGDGNDVINGITDITRFNDGVAILSAIFNAEGTIDTGNGDDIITSMGLFLNDDTIDTGNGQDSIISVGNFTNTGNVFLGDDNDSITTSIIADRSFLNRALENFNAIDTGDGDDIITSTGVIYNEGIINTGNGDDSIIVDGGIDDLTGNSYGIYNNGGAINMGEGNDSIIANDGFESAPNSSGAWFLGEGNDYIKGYGSGDFYGGNGNDTLELTPGTYTVGIWGEGGESPIFTKGNQLMITSEFEQLKVGSTIYDFSTLTAGQIIVVA